MSEEIKILLGFAAVLALAVFVFTRLCKPDEEETVKLGHSFSVPKSPPRPPMWGVATGTKVLFELGGKVVGGCIVSFNDGRYVVKRISYVGGKQTSSYYIVNYKDIFPVKEGNEND